MPRTVRAAERSIASSAASLPLESVVYVGLRCDAASASGTLLLQAQLAPVLSIEDVPFYDVIRRELRFMGVLIKKLRSDASNQICLLTCWQEQDWQGPLFDPLSPKDAIDPHKRFLDTVEAMNEHHTSPGWLQFVCDGGEKLYWAPGREAIALVASRAVPAPVRLHIVSES